VGSCAGLNDFPTPGGGLGMAPSKQRYSALNIPLSNPLLVRSSGCPRGMLGWSSLALLALWVDISYMSGATER
jgi:hypothetical protein